MTKAREARSEYGSWRAMIQRCTNPKHESWRLYGGRGITVCPEWLGSFDAFLADMGMKPTPDYTIDRIDGDGNYEPLNCRWTDAAGQEATKRAHKRVVYCGVPRSVREWCHRLRLIEHKAVAMLSAGATTAEAFTHPDTQRPWRPKPHKPEARWACPLPEPKPESAPDPLHYFPPRVRDVAHRIIVLLATEPPGRITNRILWKRLDVADRTVAEALNYARRRGWITKGKSRLELTTTGAAQVAQPICRVIAEVAA